MSYTKQDLHISIEWAVGTPLASHVNLITALRSAAVDLFLLRRGMISGPHVELIRQALSDIDRDGRFDFIRGRCRMCKNEIEEQTHGVWTCLCGSFPVDSAELKKLWEVWE